MADTSTEFAEKRYTILRNLIPAHDCAMVYRYAMVLSAAGALEPDPKVGGAASRYADPQMELLLSDLLPVVENATGLRLHPTYSFFRVYVPGDELKRHSDRPSCEVSLSICLGYDAGETWGLWVEGPHGTACARLEPGDALVYRGCECPHWREPFTGKHAAQVFLHYVEQNGPNAEFRFDRRAGLNLPATSIRAR